MFTVTGTIRSVPYRVGVHDEDMGGETPGCVMGSTNAISLLQLAVGDKVRGFPTSDEVVVDLSNPASVLACLRERTVVGAVEGDAPEPRTTPGTIY